MEADSLARKTDSIQTHDSANVKYHGKNKARGEKSGWTQQKF